MSIESDIEEIKGDVKRILRLLASVPTVPDQCSVLAGGPVRACTVSNCNDRGWREGGCEPAE